MPAPVASAALRGIDRTLRATAITACLLLAAVVLKDEVLLLFAAVLLACALRLASTAIHTRTGLAQGWCLLLVIVLLVAVFAGVGWWRGPVIAAQATDIGGQLGTRAQELWTRIGSLEWAPNAAAHIRSSLSSSAEKIGAFVTGFAGTALGAGGSLLLILATGLFLAIDPATYRDGAVRLLPVPWRPRGREVLLGVGHALQLWFMGQLLDMLVVACLIGAGLFLLGVPLALTLALFAGLLNFIPFIGALAGAAPAVLIAFGQSPQQALYVAILFVVVQTIEGNVIAPVIQKRTVSLPPALTIFSQTILGTLFGAMGLILATPVMAMLLVGVRMVYVESVLERTRPPG